MADATSLTPPNPGFSATLLANKCCKFDDDPIKNEDTVVSTTFSPL